MAAKAPRVYTQAVGVVDNPSARTLNVFPGTSVRSSEASGGCPAPPRRLGIDRSRSGLEGLSQRDLDSTLCLTGQQLMGENGAKLGDSVRLRPRTSASPSKMSSLRYAGRSGAVNAFGPRVNMYLKEMCIEYRRLNASTTRHGQRHLG